MQYLADKQPQPGQLVEIANGVMWLTMPLPFELDHINLYLIKDGDNWVIVDTGIGTSTTKALWQQIFEKLDGSISAVVVTHLHPDHIGLAGWIADEFDVPFYMSQTEYFTARAFCAGKNGASNKRDVRYFSQAGLDSELVEKLTQGDGKGFSQVVSPIPVSYTRLKHNDVLSFDNNEWKVLIGRGHSPEHACLYCESKGVLISGDHILPMITPNIGAYSTEPDALTLNDYLTTLPPFKALPEDTVVLPAHKLPFVGLHQRIDELLAHHHQHLRALKSACATPQTVAELLPVMFKRKLSSRNMVFAVAECYAHLNYLVAEGELTKTLVDDSVLAFTQCSAAKLTATH
jgi:glyoxylase-like metal-dependent hydrolase (beta-lactamase superfamily II)